MKFYSKAKTLNILRNFKHLNVPETFICEVGQFKKNPELIEILGNPFALSDGFQGPQQPNDSKPMFDEKLETWVSPFFMAPINSKNIHGEYILGFKSPTVTEIDSIEEFEYISYQIKNKGSLLLNYLNSIEK